MRLILLMVVSGAVLAGGGLLAGVYGWSWWTGLMTGIGGLMLIYAVFYLLRGAVTLVLFVQEETLFATIMKSSRLTPPAEMEYESVGYSVSVPVHSISHLWRASTSVNFVPMSDSLKLCVAGKNEVLADLMMEMVTVSDHDIHLLGTFLQRHQPDLVLSYPRPSWAS